MLKSYLPSVFNTFFAIFIFLFLLFGLKKIAAAFFILYLLLYVVLRKANVDFRESAPSTKGVIFSPCNGKVISVETGVSHDYFGQELTEIQIAIPWWNEMGIYLPLSCEILDLKILKGRSFYRYLIASDAIKSGLGKGLNLTLDNRGEKIGIALYKCRLGLWPELLVTPGDIGGRRVNIGYFPFGGTVILYLPKKYEILVNKDNELNVAESIIAIKSEIVSS